jgi:cysteine desulfurase
MRTIYFDFNATTPLDREVGETMLPFLIDVWGNPSSVHHVGRQARAYLDEARERAARVLGAKPSEITFTSGGTESVNQAILGVARRFKNQGKHIITSAVEHNAVLQTFDYLGKRERFEVTVLPVDRYGRVSPDDLEHAITSDTILVSIMAANNEIGTIQPIAELGTICRNRGVRFHTDAVQWFGKEPFRNIDQFNADLVSICAHKFHGPKGAGILYAKSPLQPDPILFGGAHENERRAGTENLAAIVGMVTAMERFVSDPVFSPGDLWPLSCRLINSIEQIEGARVVGSREFRLANTVSFVVEDSDSIALLAGLDLDGICASSGSACSSGSIEPSHVITALGLKESLANSLVRFSLGRSSTLQDVEFVERVLPDIIHRAQHSGKAGKKL